MHMGHKSQIAKNKEYEVKPNSRTIWGYCRVSTARQDLERQKLEIHEYVNKLGANIDRLVLAKAGSRRKEKERSLDVLKEAAMAGEVDTVVFSELSRLGRSVGEICRLVNYFVDDWKVALHFIKENMVLSSGERNIQSKVMLTMFSLLAEIERDLISERTKDGLAARKAQGVRLGRPPLKSKLDKDEEEIRQLLELGVTQKRLAERYKCCEATFCRWVKRKRKEWNAKTG